METFPLKLCCHSQKISSLPMKNLVATLGLLGKKVLQIFSHYIVRVYWYTAKENTILFHLQNYLSKFFSIFISAFVFHWNKKLDLPGKTSPIIFIIKISYRPSLQIGGTFYEFFFWYHNSWTSDNLKMCFSYQPHWWALANRGGFQSCLTGSSSLDFLVTCGFNNPTYFLY